MKLAAPTSPPRGRPRSEASRAAILDAALELVGRHGYGRVTIDAIAAKAGVGKQTIYRWWSARGDVMYEAVSALANRDILVPDRGNLREDLIGFLDATFAVARRSPVVFAVLRGLVAEAQTDPAFRRRFRAGLIEPRRATLRSLFERAAARGELRPGFDVDIGIDLAFGAMWYRMLVEHAPLDRRAATAIAEAVARAAI